jgi:hypothetical protein
VYLYYNRTSTNWDFSESVGPVNVEDGIDGQRILYGRAVGVSKDALAVGAPENDLGAQNSGSVYINDVIVNNCSPETPSPTKSQVSNRFFITIFQHNYNLSNLCNRPTRLLLYSLHQLINKSGCKVGMTLMVRLPAINLASRLLYLLMETPC